MTVNLATGQALTYTLLHCNIHASNIQHTIRAIATPRRRTSLRTDHTKANRPIIVSSIQIHALGLVRFVLSPRSGQPIRGGLFDRESNIRTPSHVKQSKGPAGGVELQRFVCYGTFLIGEVLALCGVCD
jgi:hypothetical protein